MDRDSALTAIEASPSESAGEATANSAGTVVSTDTAFDAVESQPATSPAKLPVLKILFAKDEPSALWLRCNDQIFVAGCVLVGLVLLYFNWIRLSRWGAEPIEIERQPERRASYRVDINRATKYEWAELDGIGPTLAERIVQDRDQNGPFRSIEDLRRVRGIGPKKLEKLAPHLEVSGETVGSSSEQQPARRKRGG